MPPFILCIISSLHFVDYVKALHPAVKFIAVDFTELYNCNSCFLTLKFSGYFVKFIILIANTKLIIVNHVQLQMGPLVMS